MLNAQVQTMAMLVHQHTATKNIDVTTHSVIDVGDGQFTLGAGRAMTVADKEALAAILLNEEMAFDFLDESILVSSRSVLCWYRKPQVVDVPFKDGSVKAPIPGLIFFVQAGQPFRCFAYKGKGRPNQDTELFYAPFGNVYSNGSFCTGNATVPQTISKANMPAWEAFVLDATNTHEGSVKPVKKVVGIEQLRGFYKELAASGSKVFPARAMTPYNPSVTYTLRMLIDGVE